VPGTATDPGTVGFDNSVVSGIEIALGTDNCCIGRTDLSARQRFVETWFQNAQRAQVVLQSEHHRNVDLAG